jgi:hypothetical protein
VIKKDWYDFKSMNGGFEGARAAFERACETTFRKEYFSQTVQQVEVKQGDGGIDVYIGKISVEPITVIQCKFFLDGIGNSQKQQITKSFVKAITSKEYSITKWILCIPKILDLEENIWWGKWIDKQAKKFNINSGLIHLINGNELIDKMKELKIYEQIFEVEESKQIIDTGKKVDAIYKIITTKAKPQSFKNKQGTDINLNDVLFYNYKPHLDKYYLLRDHDHLFLSKLKSSHLWFIGKSGSGKTVTINRNLANANIQYIFCDLSPIVINSADDVFKEIYFELSEFMNLPVENSSNILKQITKVLLGIDTSFVIVVDELSISNDTILIDLTDKIIRLINHYSNKCGSNELRFIISTINEPRTNNFNKSKASEYFDFIPIDNWDNDIKRLYDLIEEYLNLKISTESYNYIISQCSNSPRYLKNILKKVASLSELEDEKIIAMTNKAKKEFI